MPDATELSRPLDPSQRLRLLDQDQTRSVPLTGKVATAEQERKGLAHDLAADASILREHFGKQRAERSPQTPTATQDKRLLEEIAGSTRGEDQTAPTIDQLASRIENQGEGVELIDYDYDPEFTEEELASIQQDLAQKKTANIATEDKQLFDIRDDFTGEIASQHASMEEAEFAYSKIDPGRSQDMTIYEHEEGRPDSDYLNIPIYLQDQVHNGAAGAGDKRVYDALVAYAIDHGAESEISPLTGERRLTGPAAAAQADLVEAAMRRALAKKAAQQELEDNQLDAVTESIAVKLTDQQARLLLSSEYPGDRDAQNRALLNVTSEGKPVDIMSASVQLDYSRDQETFFARLYQTEKPALEQKLLQLQKNEERANAPKERDKSRQKERSRQRERD